MITAHIDPTAFATLIKELQGVGKIIADPNLQLFRASKYRQFTIEMTRRGALGLKPISYISQLAAGGSHEPEWNEQKLVNSMKVKPAGKNAADVGYFKEDTTLVPGKKITITKAAILQHTGYRISLMGPKGQKVMKWLVAIGAFDQGRMFGQKAEKSESWLEVPPRPFMFNSLARYEEIGGDIKACDAFIDKMLGAPGGKGNFAGLTSSGQGELF